MILPDLLRERVTEDPVAVALRVGDADALSYGDWDRRSSAVARGLVEAGVRPGDRVALAFGNDRLADYAVCYLGAHKAGAVAVPLGSRFTDDELDRVLAHAEPALVLRDAGVGAGRSTEPFQVPVDGGALAEILYTSGTTGLPKGVACSHANLMVHDVPADGPSGHVSFLHAFPIGTQAAQEALRVPLRIRGRTAIALPTFDSGQLCLLVERHRVVRLQLVPATAHLLVVSGAYARHDVSSVRRIVLSSAPAAPAQIQRHAQPFHHATVGETEIKIVDGEILLRRPGAPTREYYRDPAATAETFAGGWVHTGDLGHVDGDGYLHLTDRKKDVIISGGANVSSVEVEHALHEHPAVVEAAVVGIPHPVLGEDVGAALVVRAPTTERELQDLVRARLAEHKVPHHVVFVDRLPRNPSGKVVKAKVRALFAAPPAVEGDPTTETETVVASVWAAVLGVPRVGVHDDFFALGGHSLAAAQIAARLGDAFGVDVPVAAVFEAPTVAELARVVDEAATGAATG